MVRSGEPVIEVMAPDDEVARRVLRAYFDEVASRYYGRPAAEDEIAAAMRDEPSDDLVPPRGLFLVARAEADVLGCAGLRLLPGRTGEVTRVFVVPAARRRGLGTRLPSSHGRYVDHSFEKALVRARAGNDYWEDPR